MIFIYYPANIKRNFKKMLCVAKRVNVVFPTSNFFERGTKFKKKWRKEWWTALEPQDAQILLFLEAGSFSKLSTRAPGSSSLHVELAVGIPGLISIRGNASTTTQQRFCFWNRHNSISVLWVVAITCTVSTQDSSRIYRSTCSQNQL